MANGNIKVDADQDSWDHMADILGHADPSFYNKIAANPFTSMVSKLQASQPSPVIQGLSAPLSMRFGSMSGSPAPTAAPSMAPQMLGRIPPAAPDSTAVAPRSTLQKVGSVLGKIGEIAGSAVIPNEMKWIPGTDQHNNLQAELAARRSQEGAEVGKTGAETEELKARAAKEGRQEGSSSEEPPKTVASGGQAYEYNPATKHFDIPVGNPKEGAGEKATIESTPQGLVSVRGAIATPVKTPSEEVSAIGGPSPIQATPQRRASDIQPIASQATPGAPSLQLPATSSPLDIGGPPASTIAGQPVSAIQKTPAEHIKEELQSKLVAAENAGDKAQSAKLRQQLKDIDPLAENRIAVTVQGQQNTQSEREQNRQDKQAAAAEKKAKPLRDMVELAEEAHDLKKMGDSGNSSADVDLALSFFKMMRGSGGAGIRFTQQEQNLILGSKGLMEGLEVVGNKVKSNGEPLSKAQRQRMIEVMDMHAKAAERQLGDIGGQSGASTGQSPAPTHRFNPATGKIEAVK